MAHALRRIHVHIVFATKFRLCQIGDGWRGELQGVIENIAFQEGHQISDIYAMPDHVHLLIRLGPNQGIADTVRVIKAKSSQWVHRSIGLKEFAWQTGYGAFAVSFSHVEKVANYIKHQPIIHANRSMEAELNEIFALAGEKLDEQELYRWLSGV